MPNGDWLRNLRWIDTPDDDLAEILWALQESLDQHWLVREELYLRQQASNKPPAVFAHPQTPRDNIAYYLH